MKTIQQVKDEVSKELGFGDFKSFSTGVQGGGIKVVHLINAIDKMMEAYEISLLTITGTTGNADWQMNFEPIEDEPKKDIKPNKKGTKKK